MDDRYLDNIGVLWSQFNTERRSEERNISVIKAAKIICDEHEFVCLIKDISSKGVGLAFHHPVPEGSNLTLVMPSGHSIEGLEIIWSKGQRAGAMFKEAISVASCLKAEEEPQSQGVSLELDDEIEIEHEWGNTKGRILGLSQSGADLDCPTRLKHQDKVGLSSNLLGRLDARVKWRKDQLYRVELDRRQNLSDLSEYAWNRFVAKREPQ